MLPWLLSQLTFHETDFDILNSRCKHNTAVKVVLREVIAKQTLLHHAVFPDQNKMEIEAHKRDLNPVV